MRLLGIDTGGTYTDAVVMDEERQRVLASAKVPTTHHDLTAGIGSAVAAVLADPTVDGASIGLVTLSTTLATNALVEGRREAACLILAGFGRREQELIEIDERRDLVRVVAGGHDATGDELAPIDPAAVRAVVADVDDVVSAYAVATQFSVRNPRHELRIGDEIAAVSDRPITRSHELSSKLDGPRRARTTLLNAGLIALGARLESAVEAALERFAIRAPLMVVRGDGSAVSSRFVARRPIETILAGPAASIVGAGHLVGRGRGPGDGLVVDIGGTTTDIAALQGGRPVVAADGAVVGGLATMIEAIELTTCGLGGDSEVGVDPDGRLTLGPTRAVPLSRLASSHPEIIESLRRLLAAVEGPDGGRGPRLLVATGGPDRGPEPEPGSRQGAILDALSDGPRPEHHVAPTNLLLSAVESLRRQDRVWVATFTPTDAAVVLGDGDLEPDPVAIEAATAGAELLARRRDGAGRPLGTSAPDLARRVDELVVTTSADRVLEVGLRSDDLTDVAASSPVVRAGLAGHRGRVSVSLSLSEPLIAVGASADRYYHRVATRLGVEAVVPNHAPVANAVGAVVSPVRVAVTATIARLRAGRYRLHGIGADGASTFPSAAEARARGEELLRDRVTALAIEAGAEPERLAVEVGWAETTAPVGGRHQLIEATISVTATGWPRPVAG